MEKLYRAYSTLDNFKNHEQVPISWFCASRDTPTVPYEEAIDYESLADQVGQDQLEMFSRYAEGFIDECFTGQEVDFLGNYLQDRRGTELIVHECELPVTYFIMATGAIPVGGLQDFIILNDTQDPKDTLGIVVHGYFDLRHARPHKAIDPIPLFKADSLKFINLLLTALGLNLPDEISGDEVLAVLREASEQTYITLKSRY